MGSILPLILALFWLGQAAAQVGVSVTLPSCYGARVSTNNDLSATSLTVAGNSAFSFDVVLNDIQEVDAGGNLVQSCTPPCYQTVSTSSATNAANDTLSLFSISIPSCNTTVSMTLYANNDVATLSGGLAVAVQANELVVQVSVSQWSFAGAGHSLQAVLLLDFHGQAVSGADVNQTSTAGFYSLVTSVDSGVFLDTFVFPIAAGSSNTIAPPSSVTFVNGSLITLGAPTNVGTVVFQAGIVTNLVVPVPQYKNYEAANILAGIAGGIVVLSVSSALFGLLLHTRFGITAE